MINTLLHIAVESFFTGVLIFTVWAIHITMKGK